MGQSVTSVMIAGEVRHGLEIRKGKETEPDLQSDYSRRNFNRIQYNSQSTVVSSFISLCFTPSNLFIHSGIS